MTVEQYGLSRRLASVVYGCGLDGGLGGGQAVQRPGQLVLADRDRGGAGLPEGGAAADCLDQLAGLGDCGSGGGQLAARIAVGGRGTAARAAADGFGTLAAMGGLREFVGGVAALAGVALIVVFGVPGAAVVFLVGLVVAVVRLLWGLASGRRRVL